MPALLRVASQLRYFSGLDEDLAINTWHFYSPTDIIDEAPILAVVARLDAFYDEIGGYLSNYIDRENCAHRAVLIDPSDQGREISAPSFYPFTPGTPTGTNLPLEVAICLSQRTSLVGPSSAGAGKGRQFLGPLTTSTVVAPTSQAPRVNSNATGDIAAAALALGEADGMIWSIYSRKDEAVYPITDAYVDNEFDTQRRRGTDPTLRTAVSWPPPL
jgi:hypothetical protein